MKNSTRINNALSYLIKANTLLHSVYPAENRDKKTNEMLMTLNDISFYFQEKPLE